MDWLVVLLRLLHIGGGIFWVGGAFTFFLFVAPSLERLAPPDRKTFLDGLIGQRRFASIILAAATITILAGAALYWRASGGLHPAFVSSGVGLGFTIGGLAGLGAWLIAALVIGPTFTRLSGLSDEILVAGRAPTAAEGARLAGLGARLRLASRALLTFLAIAALFMAISRYIR